MATPYDKLDFSSLPDAPGNEFEGVDFSALPDATQPSRGNWQRFKDSYANTLQTGVNGYIARRLNDWLDTGKAELRKQNPNMSDDELEALSDRVISNAQLDLRRKEAELDAADPAWRKDRATVQNLLDPAVWSSGAGVLTGSVDPTFLANPGGSVSTRIGAQWAIGGGTSLATQAAEKSEGMREDISLKEAATDAVLSAGAQALLGELPGALVRDAGDILKRAKADPLEIKTPDNRMSAEGEAEWLRLLKEGTVKEMADFNTARNAPFDANAAARWVQAGRPNPKVWYAETAKNGTATETKAPAANYSQFNSQQIADHVNDLTATWENAPRFEIVDNIKQVADAGVRKALRAAEKAGDRIPGLYGEDGVVRIISKNIRSADELNGVVFHEALGHAGLSARFRDDLDNLLDDLYENSSGNFGALVDEWRVANPNAYAGDPRQNARAVEEVLAEMSQGGQIDPTTWQRIVQWVKDWARRNGIHNFKFSDQEIRTILGLSHAEITGKGSQYAPGGNRFIYIGRQGDERLSGRDSKAFEAEERLLYDGDNPEAVRQETGWFKGLDGRSKREISDRDALINRWPEPDTPESVPLREVIDHPELFRAYPDIADMPIFVRSDLGGSNGMYSPDGFDGLPEHIAISSKATKSRTTLLHEIQHAVQQREDFAKGDSPYYLANRSTPDNIERSINRVGRTEDFWRADPDQRGHLVEYDLYTRSAGEIEARDTAARATMTNEMRQRFPPYSSEADNVGDAIVKFMRGKRSPDEMRVAVDDPRKQTVLAGQFTARGLDDMLDDIIAEQGIGDVVHDGQLIESARTLGTTPKKILERQSLEDKNLAKRVVASGMVVERQLNKIDDLDIRLRTEGYSDHLAAELARETNLLAAVVAKVQGDRSELGRALRAIKLLSEGTNSANGYMRALREKGGNRIFTDADATAELMDSFRFYRDSKNNKALVKLAKDSTKPGAGDYVFSLWYNMLLSNPATHVANVVGTGVNFAMDLFEHAGAAVMGQRRRFGESRFDRVSGTEVAARFWGVFQAIKDMETWKRSGESFLSGMTGSTAANAKGSPTNLVYPGLSSFIIEGATRGLAAQDEWFRNIISLSDIYGQAVRESRKSGKSITDKSFWDDVGELIENPTTAMQERAAHYARVIQFLDEPSAVAKWINNGKTSKAKDGWTVKVGRGTLRLTVPFVNTPDALFRTAIRRMGPVGLLERENLGKLTKADNDIVKARMLIGSVVMGTVAYASLDGMITGQGPADRKKRAEWAATHQPNSIKIGDQWVPYNGLEPISTVLSAVATATERNVNGNTTDREFSEAVWDNVTAVGRAMADTAYTQNLLDLFDAMNSDGESNYKLANWVASVASSSTTPAFVRAYAQEEDRAIRDTTGSGSFEDRVAGRVMSGQPGTSEQLPQRYDVYGRPMERGDAIGPSLLFNRFRTKEAETDPTILELQRLGETVSAPLVGAPGKTVKVDGEQRRLNAEEFQEYQRVSGEFIVDSITETMADPDSGWNEMTDEEKIAYVKKVVTAMRKYAREDLFNDEETENEE